MGVLSLIEIIKDGNYDSSGRNRFVKIRTDEIVHGAEIEGVEVEIWTVNNDYEELWDLTLHDLLQSFIDEEGLKSMVGLRRIHGRLHEDSGAGAYGGLNEENFSVDFNNDVIENISSFDKIILGLIIYLGFNL